MDNNNQPTVNNDTQTEEKKDAGAETQTATPGTEAQPSSTEQKM
ncbi:MAG TPA: hypothetical protein VG982_00265 [Candidatus Paceibacterota bacterium]|jgi:hypothetical protein|nr:hypothetical protein [Candidatus Paceibacterota bacterium]